MVEDPFTGKQFSLTEVSDTKLKEWVPNGSSAVVLVPQKDTAKFLEIGHQFTVGTYAIETSAPVLIKAVTGKLGVTNLDIFGDGRLLPVQNISTLAIAQDGTEFTLLIDNQATIWVLSKAKYGNVFGVSETSTILTDSNIELLVGKRVALCGNGTKNQITNDILKQINNKLGVLRSTIDQPNRGKIAIVSP